MNSSSSSRPLDSGRKDALGRTIRVSGDVTVNRSDAPSPPDSGNQEGGWVPPAVAAGFVTYDGKTVAQRVTELGWPAAQLVEIEGEEEFDDSRYFTPRWMVMVDQRLVDRHGKIGAIDAAVHQACRSRYHTERAGGASHDDAIDALDNDVYASSIDRTYHELGTDHLDNAGLVLLNEVDDGAEGVDLRDIDLFFDDHDFNPDAWRGITLEFPNGTPNRYDYNDNTVWFHGNTVTVSTVHGDDISFVVDDTSDDTTLTGTVVDDDGDPIGMRVNVPIAQIETIEIP